MKVILDHELQDRCENELSILFLIVSQHLAQTVRCSPERRNALASLENISEARLRKMLGCTAL